MRPPRIIKTCMENFALFYKQKHEKRCLEWLWGVGSAVIRARYPTGRRIEINATALQAAAILQFNEQQRYTLSELARAMGVEVSILKRVMASMCFVSKMRLFKKFGSEGRGIDDTDVLEVDCNYKSPKAVRSSMAACAFGSCFAHSSRFRS